uniref:RNA polymerase Rpb4/RPC9 core domain-containing protein n=1 Tax=Hemiselmis andersenii TaxID=464988 RepID=A0A6U2HTM3_HEMAN|mmetsp:Transcript_42829/g.99475  ORF Transcript_42829/g.99475 Transcript_42829/m.99475 type:complete len:144 (+) Transcript_42829:3-434(+)
MTDQRVTKRRKAGETEKVDIANLIFGDDFEEAEAMLNAEVRTVIEKLNETNQLERDDMSEMMVNTTKYVETFGEFQDLDSISLCKRELQELRDLKVHGFEAASLCNLMPATADEAKSLIASLKRFDDDDVTQMCNIVQRYKKT